MNIKLAIETYLKDLALSNRKDLIKDIFLFLEKEIKTENATGNEERIATLFFRAVESLNQNTMPEDDIKKAILNAFENIRTIENNTHNNGELMCIYLLNLLYSKEDVLEGIPQNDFVFLLDNLEKIRCIFKISDVNNNLVFPIGRFLFRLINCDNLYAEIEKASSVQALMLALQVFDKAQYPQELKDIENMIDGKNLKFIEYLYHKCIRLGDDDWKKNYEKNGLLVLYDTKVKKVLIRNNKSSYFSSKYDTSNYKLSNVTAETNANGEAIAYFVEYSFDEYGFVDLAKEFSVENNIDRIAQILDIIYYYRNYNIIFESALHDRQGKIYPTNPFGENDPYVVDEGMAHKDGKSYISDKLFKYGLLKISGSGLKYINLGAVVKLDEINAIQFKDFKIGEKSDLNNIIDCWLDFCDDKQKCFDAFFKDYGDQISYIFDSDALYEKKYKGEYLIPGILSEELLKKLELDEKLFMYKLDQCNLKIDYLQEKNIITDSSHVKLNDFIIEDISGEDVNIFEGNFFALINDAEKKIYVGSQVNYFYLVIEKIKKIKQGALSEADITIISESDVKSISKQMLCFKDAFENIHPRIPIESVARYRLINHMMFLKPSKADIKNWLSLIKKHEIEDFSVVKKRCPIGETAGVLYVPKDRSRAQSTLKHINNRYFNNPIERNLVDIYDQTIEKIGNNYYTGGKEIKKVVLLFDNIQNGKSTKETIDKYINDKECTTSDTSMVFVCNGNVIALSEILNSNRCKIEIFSIYAADTGIRNVKNYVKEQYPNMSIKVLDPIRKLTSVVNKTDIELINKLYPGKLAGGIRENQYLVVREYNQPKLNIMCDKLLEIERVVAIFCKRKEL
ncbi:hypothetical protein [uncultured Solobacterium sp.]|uniref:hypothetical protein n=1 Tax=uncultured Solobacterium sp. TaxID=747375 RepID=UPI0028D2E4F7|nr:hypothetical protein [uncultured Solobacterium sp.]